MPRSAVHRTAILLITISFILGNFVVARPAAVEAAPQDLSNAAAFPVADAFVKAGDPNMNFGTSTDLRTRYSPDVHSFLRFSVTVPSGSSIVRAQLKLYVTSTSAYALRAMAVPDNSWSESTITYNNRPPLGLEISKSGPVSAGTWVILDVTSYVKAQGTYSIGLITAGSAPIYLASRESGSTTPRLVITLDGQPTFPIRAAFYYPWFPQAWKQDGIFPYTNYKPQLGYYDSTSTTTLKRHIAMMQYARIQAGIASWWGPNSQTDAKIPGLLNAAAGTDFRWSLYYEQESQANPSVLKIHNDLVYIRNRYGSNPNFLRVDGKAVVFVYASPGDDCTMADRWKQANSTVGVYVVLKVFPGFDKCASQPNSWHQYCPAVASDKQDKFSFSISPGFWQKGHPVRLARDILRWQKNVRDMVASGARWQLVTTFSEWGEGTAVEPGTLWLSPSGNGSYLDALHYNGHMPVP